MTRRVYVRDGKLRLNLKIACSSKSEVDFETVFILLHLLLLKLKKFQRGKMHWWEGYPLFYEALIQNTYTM